MEFAEFEEDGALLAGDGCRGIRHTIIHCPIIKK
jgi:hypothetical protein